MKTVFGASGVKPQLSKSVLTIGNFDGVHLGHRELIGRLLKKAGQEGLPSVVFTFDPHPVTVLRPETPFLRLFDPRDQQSQLAEMGVDYFIVERFTKDFAEIPAEKFLQNYLFGPFNPLHLVVGYDFSFGANKEGTIEHLREFAANRLCTVEVVEPVKWQGEVISSSLIRRKVVAGEIAVANDFLGRPYFIEGEVEKGDQRGRQLGFPTANLSVTNEVRPRAGVYVTRTQIDGQFFRSVSNLGVRPTFKGNDEDSCYLETHVFNFADSIYGRKIKVELLGFLRSERRFSGIEELKTQIENDCRRAHEVHDEMAGDWRRVQ